MKEAIAHLTPETITQAFEGTNLGHTDFEVIPADTVLKHAAGSHSNHTTTCIMVCLTYCVEKQRIRRRLLARSNLLRRLHAHF
jgi:hypothetical protein